MTPLESASKHMMPVYSLPLPRQRHSARINGLLTLLAIGTFAYVLYWLIQHSFVQEPHHYITALVIALWLAALPFLSLYRILTERSKHHGHF